MMGRVINFSLRTSTIRMLKSRGRWEGHAAHMGIRVIHIDSWWGSHKEEYH
jgi:hypothetical protein